ncbi:hypothetical protein CPB83DRAFT_840547 [Crepidotus variabilis]|uniref:Uncharacterized protein n=1 Tax=Crepidotus variabilis TaxID=179855 RepID=A0A9P6E4D8_9AGAR|nr:hypothetical protein CPB83DRAFT_840547 [Crepidotus variabilis]
MVSDNGSQKDSGKSKGKETSDWFDTTVNGANIILSALRDASALAPVPYLQQAAGSTLTIIQTIQTVKDNKADLQQLAEDAGKVITAIYSAYLQSDDKEEWPGKPLEEGLKELVSTLQNIQTITDARSRRRLPGRFINSLTDVKKVQEYRMKLNQALQVFGVSAQLQSYEILRKLEKRSEVKVKEAHQMERVATLQREERETELHGMEERKERADVQAVAHVETLANDVAREVEELKREQKLAKLREEELDKKRAELERARFREEEARRLREEREEHQKEMKRLRDENQALERRRKEDEEEYQRRRRLDEQYLGARQIEDQRPRSSLSTPSSSHQGGVSFFNGASNVSIGGNSSFTVTTRS